MLRRLVLRHTTLRATAARTAAVRRLATARTNADARTVGRGRVTAWAALALAGAAGAYALATRRKSSCDGAGAGAGGARKQYALSEVARHRSKADGGIWVTYRDGVYDVTEWAELHPGGREKILLAAGGAIDPFWAMYQQHNTAQVKEILEKYRIGDVAEADRKAQPVVVGDPYANDPTDRHPALTVLTQKPFNAEPPAELLAASYITPTEFYFKRNHLPVPVTAAGAAQAAADWRLTVKGEGMVTRTLSLDDLARLFPRHTVTVTTQCAGNRRAELNPIKPVKGLAWGVGAISTATWTGVRLRDVLAYAGLNGYDASVQAGVKHVQFEGTDTDPTTGTRYGASIPVHKALDERGDVLLAFEMNGKPIPLDHGYPLRVIVPGVVGARHVKWVNTIVGSAGESLSHWQQNDYKSFSPAVDWDSVDWKSAPAIQELPVQSAICEPKPGTTVDADSDVTVKGYAWSGGGRGIARVDVSADGGKTWSVATLSPEASAQESGRAWAWYPFTATVTVRPNANGAGAAAAAAGGGSTELICKAVDTAYNNQPDTVAPVYNLRGVANNAWHRVRLNIAAPTPASSAGAASA